MGLIYLDACVLIYAVERSPLYGERVLQALDHEAASGFAISSLVKLECLVRPLKDGDFVLQRRYEDAFAQLELLALPDSVYIEAAQLRSRFALRTPDALHLACAQHHGCAALWTNDGRLAQASHGLAQNVVA